MTIDAIKCLAETGNRHLSSLAKARTTYLSRPCELWDNAPCAERSHGGSQMKRFSMLVPAVAVGISLLGLTTARPATAGIPQGTGTHRVPVRVMNLHKAYEARLGYATAAPIAGVVPPVGTLSPGRGGNNCVEPACPVVYNGGPVQHSPHVYLLLWGPNWKTDPNQMATATYLANFYSGLGVQPNDNWSTITSEYGDSTGKPTFSGSVFEGTFYDLSTPATGVGQSGLATEADVFASQHGITDLNDAQIVIATQSGTCPAGFEAPSCGAGGYYCAWHSYSNEPYTNLPYLLDAGTACGEDFVNSNGTYDGFSIVGGHEYAETISDPFPPSGWSDPIQSAFGEIADKCAWDHQHSHNVMLSTGPFAMQPLWSNNTNGCVMHIGDGTDIVNVTNPGTQSTYQKSVLSISVGGSSSGGHQLTWSATGLPASLTITTGPTGVGVISGKLTAAPSTTNPYKVTVLASDSTGAFGWATFNWYVLADVGKPISNQASHTCLNDRDYNIAAGNSVFMWTCLKGAAEMFTHPTNAGQLIVLGVCLTDPTSGSKGGPGTLQVVDPCNPNDQNQQWLYNSKNEYVLLTNFLCLTDQNGSTAKGAPVVIEPCTGATDQRWTGP